MKEEESGSCGWTKLYHPKGVLVTIPVTATPLDYRALIANVGLMLDAGFLVTAPGLEEGEHREEVGFVVMRSKENNDGSSTPIVDLYTPNDQMKFSFLSVYLNKEPDEAAFEFASGMKLDNLQPYIGAGKLERGASRQTDRFIIKAPKNFSVVFKDNPKYDPNEQDTAKKKPKRLFVRWADQKPDTQETPKGTTPASPPSERDTLIRLYKTAETREQWKQANQRAEKVAHSLTPEDKAAIRTHAVQADQELKRLESQLENVPF